MTEAGNDVPQALRNWFLLHFFVDVLFAIPLMIAPKGLLHLFGWQTVDVITARVVAAALFGIGIESYLGQQSDRQSYIGMLNLKIVWSLAVVLGVSASLVNGAQGGPVFAWVLVGVFAAFNFLWLYWRWRLRVPTGD